MVSEEWSAEELLFEGQRKEKIPLKSNVDSDNWREGRKKTIGLKMGYKAKSVVIGIGFLETETRKAPTGKYMQKSSKL